MSKAAKKASFEESLEKLEELVRELESGQKGLEESIQLFERGVVLARELSKQLEEAKHKVEQLNKTGGKLEKEEFPG